MIDGQLHTLLDSGVDASWFETADEAELHAHLRVLKAHISLAEAVEANVLIALNRLRRKRSPRAKPSEAADDLKDQTGTSGADANRKAKRANLFDRWPQLTLALAAGLITAGHADLLTHIPERFHDQLEHDLDALLQKAQSQAVDEFRHTVRQWSEATATAAGENVHQQRRARRTCSVHSQADGMVRLTALLDPEAGGIVRNAITSQAQHHLKTDQEGDQSDRRTHQQRMADALTDVCSSGPGRERGDATVVVTISLADLRAGLDGQVLGTGPISAETVRRLACENGIVPMVLGSSGAVLDVGRRSRLATRSQRLALAIQYENCCAVPGCDRPFEWCHIHHIDHWEHGGSTDLDNLIPVCTRHHTQIHDGRLEIRRTNGSDNWQRRAVSESDGLDQARIIREVIHRERQHRSERVVGVQ